MTKILPCKCQHDYQDQKYGKGNRVWNSGPTTGSGSLRWRCTVCGAERTSSEKGDPK